MKLTKLTCLLFVPFLLSSCNSNEDKVLPLITKIDLTDSKLVIYL